MSAALDQAAATLSEPLVRMRGIRQSFGATRAVDGVDLDLFAGETLGLVGENGAGKSTLMRILDGLCPFYEGEITIAGKKVRMARPADARAQGIAFVHQELSLLDDLTVAENIFLGREPSSRIPGLISPAAAERQARHLLDGYGIAIDPAETVGRLSLADRQLVEIVKGVSANPKLLILDEPTSSLTTHEARELFAIVDRLKRDGTSIVYISHKLGEIFAVTDRVSVMRDGRHVATAPTAEWSEAALVRAMVGRDLSALFPRSFAPPGPVRLAVSALSRPGAFADISLTLRAGEVLGLYGMIGAGRTELAEALYGLSPASGGRIAIDGADVAIASPAKALAAGIAMVPEDRRREGLVPMLSIRENLTLSGLAGLSRAGFVKHQAERGAVANFLKLLLVRAASAEQEVWSLSGGNQQKVVIARALLPQPKVLILDEPTRGIDVVAKAEVHGIVDRLTRNGLAVLLISSELPEILGMSDRVAVMRGGRIVGEVPRAAATEERLVAMAAGAAHGQ